jgi:hypothetical protein
MLDKTVDGNFHQIDAGLLIQEMTPAQAESLLGGYCQPHEDYPCAYIINITRSMNKPKDEPKNKDINNFSDKKINTIDNSRKSYINGILIKGERSIVAIC